MKKIWIATVIAFVAVSGVALANSQITFDKVFLIGRGIAISTSNSTDLHFISIASAQVDLSRLISELSKYQDLPLGIQANVTVGVFHFDQQSYKLTNFVSGNNTITTDISLNGTTVGLLSLQSTIRAGRIVWIGNLTLNGNSYNAYILEAGVRRDIVNTDDRIDDVCKSDSSRCQSIGANAQIATAFCANNPDDSRCINLERTYCVKNLDDERCRQLLVSQCANSTNSTNPLCDHAQIKIPPIKIPEASENTDIGANNSNISVNQNGRVGEE